MMLVCGLLALVALTGAEVSCYPLVRSSAYAISTPVASSAGGALFYASWIVATRAVLRPDPRFSRCSGGSVSRDKVWDPVLVGGQHSHLYRAAQYNAGNIVSARPCAPTYPLALFPARGGVEAFC